MADESNVVMQISKDYMNWWKRTERKRDRDNMKGMQAAVQYVCLIFGCYYGEKLLLIICNSFNLDWKKKGKLKYIWGTSVLSLYRCVDSC